jgi:hypothetical protein
MIRRPNRNVKTQTEEFPACGEIHLSKAKPRKFYRIPANWSAPFPAFPDPLTGCTVTPFPFGEEFLESPATIHPVTTNPRSKNIAAVNSGNRDPARIVQCLITFRIQTFLRDPVSR